jgi:hypothetical protein
MKTLFAASLALLASLNAHASTGNVEPLHADVSTVLNLLLLTQGMDGAEKMPACLGQFQHSISSVDYANKLTSADEEAGEEQDVTYEIVGTAKNFRDQIALVVTHGEGYVECEVKNY